MGGHLMANHKFDRAVQKADLETIRGASTDLLVCAALPGEKWRANQNVDADWQNVTRLAEVLTSVEADLAILVSTIDVYQPAQAVDEKCPANFDGPQAYGRNRAWFEAGFRSWFPNSKVIRLPGLYSIDVRKNLVHDLIHGKRDQLARVHRASTYQFLDVRMVWAFVEWLIESDIDLVNMVGEPVTAGEIADLFGEELSDQAERIRYDVKSIFAGTYGGDGGYMFSRQQTLEGIDLLAKSGCR